jgi:hypothetical protein
VDPCLTHAGSARWTTAKAVAAIADDKKWLSLRGVSNVAPDDKRDVLAHPASRQRSLRTTCPRSASHRALRGACRPPPGRRRTAHQSRGRLPLDGTLLPSDRQHDAQRVACQGPFRPRLRRARPCCTKDQRLWPLGAKCRSGPLGKEASRLRVRRWGLHPLRARRDGRAAPGVSARRHGTQPAGKRSTPRSPASRPAEPHREQGSAASPGPSQTTA